MELSETCTLIYEISGGQRCSVIFQIMQLEREKWFKTMINATVSRDALLPQHITVSNYLPDPGQVLLFGSSQLLIIYLGIANSREGGKSLQINFFEPTVVMNKYLSFRQFTSATA